MFALTRSSGNVHAFRKLFITGKKKTKLDYRELNGSLALSRQFRKNIIVISRSAFVNASFVLYF